MNTNINNPNKNNYISYDPQYNSNNPQNYNQNDWNQGYGSAQNIYNSIPEKLNNGQNQHTIGYNYPQTQVSSQYNGYHTSYPYQNNIPPYNPVFAENIQNNQIINNPNNYNINTHNVPVNTPISQANHSLDDIYSQKLSSNVQNYNKQNTDETLHKQENLINRSNPYNTSNTYVTQVTPGWEVIGQNKNSDQPTDTLNTVINTNSGFSSIDKPTKVKAMSISPVHKALSMFIVVGLFALGGILGFLFLNNRLNPNATNAAVIQSTSSTSVNTSKSNISTISASVTSSTQSSMNSEVAKKMTSSSTSQQPEVRIEQINDELENLIKSIEDLKDNSIRDNQ